MQGSEASDRPRSRSMESTQPTPQPDLKIISSRVYRGPNVWHYEPAIQLVVDLGVLEDFPTNKLPGFADALVERLPGLANHSLQPRPPGRVRGAAARGHLARPRGRARRPAAAAVGRPRHAPRQDPAGEGRARPLQRDLRLLRRVGRSGRRRAGGQAGQRPGPARTRSSTSRPSWSGSSSAASGRRSVRRPRPSWRRRSAGTSPTCG